KNGVITGSPASCFIMRPASPALSYFSIFSSLSAGRWHRGRIYWFMQQAAEYFIFSVILHRHLRPGMMPPHGSIGRSVMVCSVLPSVCWSDSGYRGGATGRNVLPIQPALYKMDRAVEHKAEQSILRSGQCGKTGF